MATHAHPAWCAGANAWLQELCEQARVVLADAAQQAQRFAPERLHIVDSS